MIVVADSGPLRSLLVIGCIDALPRLFDRVLIPVAVHAELTHIRTPAPVRAWMENPPAWLEVHPPIAAIDPSMQALDSGEQQAISLAMRVAVHYILMDDEEGRVVANQLGFEVIGTIGILQQAASRGLLDLRRAITQLLATNFRISPALRQTIIEQIEER